MRIAVDCRFLCLTPSLQTRGIPRFIKQQLRAVLDVDRDNEYLLLHRASDDVTLLPVAIRQAPNVTLHPFPGESSSVGRPARTLAATEEFERWLLAQRVDLFHATAPWLPVITVFPRLDACPVITTVYDLIPALFHEHLVGELKDGWGIAVEQLHRSTRLLAISHFTARDLALHFGMAADRIDVAHPFAEPFCQPLAADVVEARLARLRRESALPPHFAMTVSFPGFRNKNLETLLDGYQRLPASLRQALPLVVVGVQGPSAEGLHSLCRHRGIESAVVPTGIVTDDEMAALYNAATLLVCPSRYEGFGLPIAEAMQCGTPVLTTTAASMPEVAGGAAWLVEAEDAGAFASAIEALAGDPARRAEMTQAGLEQVRRFSHRALGQATLDAYRRTAAEHPVDAARSRVAVCLRNPTRVDDEVRAALEVADALAVETQLDLFVSGDGLPAPDLFRRFRLHDVSALERIDTSRPYDAILRSTADPASPISWQVTTAASPSTTTLLAPTDVAAARLRARTAMAAATVRVVLPGVADPLGPQPLLQKEQARAQLGLTTSSFVVAWPEPSGEPDDARTVLVAFADLCRLCPQAWLFVGGCDQAALALPPSVAIYARSLGVIEKLRVQVTATAAAVASTVPAATADAYLVAADVVLAIDAPDRVVAPQAVLRACAAGKVAIVSDSDAWRWLPDDGCMRVPTGLSAPLVLGKTLRALSHDSARRAAIGRAAREAYEREFTLDRMRVRVLDAIGLTRTTTSARTEASADAPAVSAPLGFNRVCNIEDFRDPELVAEMREVMAYKHRHFGDTYPAGVEHCKDWEVAMATRTLRHFGALRPDAAILGVAAGMEDTIFYLTRHVREVMAVDRYAQAGVWQLNSPLWMLVTPEWGAQDGCVPERLVVQHMDARRLRFPDDRFDGIFSSGSIEHFGGLMDVAHAAYEMGRVLKPGGILSLSTVISIAGPPDRMGTPGTCLMFQPEQITRYIIEASGLELVDPFDSEATPATHAIHRPLEAVLTSVAGSAAAHGLKGLQEDYKYGSFPCLALDWDGVTFDSVHLALTKPLGRARVANAWARPSAATESAIADDYRRLVEDYDAWTPANTQAVVPVDRQDIAAGLQARGASRQLRHLAVNLASDLDGLRSEVDRHAAAALATPLDPPALGRQDTWLPIPVSLPAVPPFAIFVDRGDRRDIVANAYLNGYADLVNIAEFSVIRAFVKPGDAVVDAGAHLGSITLPLAAIGCRVLAVEASARNATMLRASVAYNGFRDVTVVRAAAAAAEGTLGFLSDGAWGWVAPPGEARNEIVPAVRIDDLVAGLGWDRVAAIKIDVEGSELAAFTGLSRLLSRADAPAIYYESNTHTLGHAGTRAGDLVAALEAYGYRSFVVSPGLLTRVHPDDVQREVVRDHLAIKGELPRLAGFAVKEGPRRR